MPRPSPASPEAIYWSTALAMVAAMAVTVVAMQWDPRTIDGHTSVWTKPLKFELSLAVHAATLGLACSYLSPPHRRGAAMRMVALAFLGACLIEMGYIIVQGARGEHSHFNVGTPFHRTMYAVMAIAAVIIVGAAAGVAVACAADRDFDHSPTVKAAIVLGFIGGTALTLVTAFTIGARMGPFVGGIPDFSARMAFTGWSQSSGDLRVSHFLATHMIQMLPAWGVLIDRFAAGRAGLLLVVSFAALWSLLTIQQYQTALAGRPSVIATAFQ